MDNAFNGMLFKRHSIRKYADKPVSPDAVKQILEAGLLSPSSKSARPWEFVVVEDRDMLTRLSECKNFGSKPIANAAFAVVICADPERSDVWIEDSAVAATLMHLQSTAIGVGSCWIQIRLRDSKDGEPAQNIVKQLLNIPDCLQVPIILTFGISDETRKPVDPEKLLWEKAHIGQYSAPATDQTNE